MYSNVLDTVYCETPEMAEKLFNFLRSEGYAVMQASAEINTGTRGNHAAKQLMVFKPEKEQKYNNVNEMIKDVQSVLDLFRGQPCTFSVGCAVVTVIGDQTLLNVDDWGVYEDEETGNVSIYNEDSDKVITLIRGMDSGQIATTLMRVTTLGRAAGVPVRWNVPPSDNDNLKSVIKSRAIGLSELTEEEEINELTKEED